MHPELIPHQVHLTKLNIRRLKRGEATVLKHDQLKGGGSVLHLSRAQTRKLDRNHRRGQGVTIQLTQPEYEATITGEGLSWKGFQRGAKKIGKAVWKGYKKYIKPVAAPIIKQGLHSLVNMGAAAGASALGQPLLAPQAAAIGDAAVGALGEVTGAYGLKHKPGCPYYAPDALGSPRADALKGGCVGKKACKPCSRKRRAPVPRGSPPAQDDLRFSSPGGTLTRRVVKTRGGIKLHPNQQSKDTRFSGAIVGGSFLPAGY